MAEQTTDVLPFSDSDEAIAAAVRDANVPCLMMSLIHLTGDLSILDGDIRPKGRESVLDLDGGIPEDEKVIIRQRVVEALIDYRDRGCPELPQLASDVVAKMASFAVADSITDEYLPMIAEEMRLDGGHDDSAEWRDSVDETVRKNFHVVIIGAGMSGILTGVKLKNLGIDYTIIEKNDEVGGTWLENTYPGLRVDIPNHFYSYSFERNPEWSHFYSKQAELLEYFKGVADKYALRDKIRFGQEVVEAVWSDEDATWTVEVVDREGAKSYVKGNALVSGVGQLNRPKLPDIKGRETFAGPSFHTARFDHSVSLEGKRVAIIGAAATALQLLPEVAKVAGKVLAFQRSAHWMWNNPQYHEVVPDGKKWTLKHVPFYASWYRFFLFWGLTDGARDMFKIDQSWPHQERSINPVNDMFREIFIQNIKDQIGDRPDLFEKLVPKYPPFADRICIDNGNYLRSLTRPNVDLIAKGVAEIDETGIIDSDGVHHEVDVIIYATGFHVQRYLFPMRFVGRNGLTVNDFWNGEGRAYLGITMPNFPNLFMLWGPGTSGATGGSGIFIMESQCRYIMSGIRHMIENDLSKLECKKEAFDGYVERYKSEVSTMIWATPHHSSYFMNDRGTITYPMTWRLVDYYNWTSALDLADYNTQTDVEAEVIA